MNRRVLLGAVMLAGLVAGRPAHAADTSGLKVTWVHGNAAVQAEQRVQAGFSDWLKASRYDWQMSYEDAGGSAEKTASHIQDAVARGVDAIIVTMADLRGSRAALPAARDHKIPVFSVDSGVEPGVVADVAANDWAMSAEVSAYLLDRIGGKGGIVVLRTNGRQGTRERDATLATVLKEYPEVKVLAEHDLDPGNVQDDTKRVVQGDATRFGDGITAVWAPSDDAAGAAADALKAAGIRAWVTGMDGEPSALMMVCEPELLLLATVAQPFEEMGAKTGSWIHAVVEAKEDPAKLFPVKEIYLPARLITKASCDKR